MSKVRPPRTPQGEDPKVTIANQDRQIEQLLARIETISTSYGQAMNERNTWKAAHDSIKQERDKLAYEVHTLRSEGTYSNGYIARVKEEDGHRYGDLPK